MKSKILLISLVVLGVPGVSVAEVHQAVEMMVVKNQQPQAGDVIQKQRLSIINSFRQAYSKTGQPKLAVFWNRKFDDQLSQWYQVSRSTQTKTASNRYELSSDPAITRSINYDDKVAYTQYKEVRLDTRDRAGFNEADAFEFSSGFTSTLIDVPTKIIDRDTIMRLMDRKNAKDMGAALISDNQKVETDALVGYADYLAEILLARDPSAETGWSFMVSVMSLNDGRVVAKFKSEAKTPETPPEERWVATSKGYQKTTIRKEKESSLAQVGEQLAFETMHALTKAWR